MSFPRVSCAHLYVVLGISSRASPATVADGSGQAHGETKCACNRKLRGRALAGEPGPVHTFAVLGTSNRVSAAVDGHDGDAAHGETEVHS